MKQEKDRVDTCNHAINCYCNLHSRIILSKEVKENCDTCKDYEKKVKVIPKEEVKPCQKHTEI